MLIISVIVIIFAVSLVLVYKKLIVNKPVKGKWLTIDKDIKLKNNLEWDISNKSVVKILNFRPLMNVLFGKDLYISLKDTEAIVIKTKGNCILDVCDNYLNSIYHIIDPKIAVFSLKKEGKSYTLKKDKKYIFFMRTEVDDNSRILGYKIPNVNKIDFKKIKRKETSLYTDEEDLFSEFYKKCSDINNAMKKRGYILTNIHKSQEYLSFPNKTISNKVEVVSELGDVFILVTTNKKLTSNMKNHTIEINSANNSFLWKPEDNETISHLLLDNCDQDDTFTFYERTTNLSNNSNILPFQVLMFKRDYNIS